MVCAIGSLAQAQWFSGATAGIATLTGDSATSINAARTGISLYQPANGPALQVFAGKHVREYFSFQAAYSFNRNNYNLTTLDQTASSENSFTQSRRLRQDALGVDGLIYFRPRSSRVRPYVSGGLGWIHLSSSLRETQISKGNPTLPANTFSSNKPYWRTAVGMDIRLKPGWQFRYTFWETVSSNTLSSQLRPQGKSLFLNFLNQFGIVHEF